MKLLEKFTKQKCFLCGNTSKTWHEIRFNVLEGTIEKEICEDCANILDGVSDAKSVRSN